MSDIIEVVAAVRRETWFGEEDRYWICRRAPTEAWAGKWEYPGGKVEEGETRADALRREMLEEFGVEITIHQNLDSVASSMNGKDYHVIFFAVQFKSEPELRVHDKTRWCTLNELTEEDHLPSGQKFNERLFEEARMIVDNLTWICHACGDTRPDDKISVHQKPLVISGMRIGDQNIRYCNDRSECFERAKVINFVPEEMGRHGRDTA